MKTVKKILHILGKAVLGLLCFIVVYVVLAFVVSRITVNSEDENPENAIAIYIKSNGVHTDIVLPLQNEIKDWRPEINPIHTVSKDTAVHYVAIGWGDRDFYLNTPQWSDLKASTAFNAAFYLGTSAMHTVFFKEIRESNRCKKVSISPEEYKKLVAFVEESFRIDNDGNTFLIANAHYGNHDSFYEANGKYNLFYTCNSWANNALKAAGQKAALWSLTDTGILCHYEE